MSALRRQTLVATASSSLVVLEMVLRLALLRLAALALMLCLAEALTLVLLLMALALTALLAVAWALVLLLVMLDALEEVSSDLLSDTDQRTKSTWSPLAIASPCGYWLLTLRQNMRPTNNQLAHSIALR
jgi:hypothetical protein